jgi:DNA gyrase subunit A
LFSQDRPFAREVIDIPVQQEMSESFLAYSLSVITARAIPDVRDGLKPVQRRILHAMAQMGLRPDRPHRKCAGVVGETMGKYHPHGDGAIYDALVRMGQDFSRNITLVDPHGNFGSLDDPPAAYRYTECRLSEAAIELLAEIDEDTIDFRSTFDGENAEPVYLPAKLPNLLVNGTSGIAVGMATNMAPHNLVEVFELIKLVLTQRRPKPTVEELMSVIPAPDFPSGGIIIDDSIAEAYTTGRGSFRIRALAQIDAVKGTKRHQIIVTELPYLVGPERVISRIQELANTGKLVGIADVKNLSDRKTGLNLVIETKPGVNPHAMLTELYRQTPLEESFGINNVVLVNGTPTTIGLWDLANHYIEHRLDVIVRRSEYRRRRAQERLHIVEGLLIALDAIDLVVSIIRSSQDAAEAKQRLMAELALSEIQATHILDMQLRRLTALEKLKLVEERDELRSRIAELDKILGSEQRRRTIVINELGDLAERFGRPRRSRVINPDQLNDVSLEVAIENAETTDDPCVIALSASNMVGREPVDGPKQASFGRHDVLWSRALSSTMGFVYAITDRGRCLAAPAGAIAEVTGRSRGTAAADAFTTDKGETLLTLVSPQDTEPLLVATANGVMKRLAVEEVISTPNGKTIINLKPGDAVVHVASAPDDAEVVAVASNAQAMRCEVSAISIQGRGAAGVAGMKLTEGARLIAAGVITPQTPDAIILTVTDARTAKVTDAAEIPTKGRGTGGVRVTKFKDEHALTFAYVGPEAGVSLVVGSEDAPTRPDPNPEPLTIPHTARDLQSRSIRRPILAVGFGRW